VFLQSFIWPYVFLLVLIFKGASKSSIQNHKYIASLVNVAIIELIILFFYNLSETSFLRKLFDLQHYGFALLITISAINGWRLAFKKI
jgi:hypothetical protein